MEHLSTGTKCDEDRLSRGINFMGIVCLGGQEVWDRKSGDQMGSGPNVSLPLRNWQHWGVDLSEKEVPTFFMDVSELEERAYFASLDKQKR